MRLLLYLCFLFVLCGCNTLSLPTVFVPMDQQLFVQGMDEVDAKGGIPDAFATLQQNYPKSPWTHRAQTVIGLLDTIRNQQNNINRLKNEINPCRHKNEEFQKKIESLEIEREKLRRLLIDMESRRG